MNNQETLLGLFCGFQNHCRCRTLPHILRSYWRLQILVMGAWIDSLHLAQQLLSEWTSRVWTMSYMYQWTKIVSKGNKLKNLLFCNYLFKVSCSWLSWGIQVPGNFCWFKCDGKPRRLRKLLRRLWRLPFLHIWHGRSYLCALRNLSCENGLWNLCKWGRIMFKRITWQELLLVEWKS